MRRDVFQAIADPTRRAIIDLVAAEAMTPNTIAGHFYSSRQAISRHLKILAECELLRAEQQGREIYYHFNARKMQEVDHWLGPLRNQWESRFDKLDTVLNQLKKRK